HHVGAEAGDQLPRPLHGGGGAHGEPPLLEADLEHLAHGELIVDYEDAAGTSGHRSRSLRARAARPGPLGAGSRRLDLTGGPAIIAGSAGAPAREKCPGGGAPSRGVGEKFPGWASGAAPREPRQGEILRFFEVARLLLRAAAARARSGCAPTKRSLWAPGGTLRDE